MRKDGRRTDRHDEANSRFSPLWKRACQNANRGNISFRTGETAVLSEGKVWIYVERTVRFGAVCCSSERTLWPKPSPLLCVVQWMLSSPSADKLTC
jgi:hypothetical protein